MEITKHEILASFTIFAVMLCIGFFISGKIQQSQLDKNEKYNTAVKIENNKSMFEYGMRTNVGNAFIYGNLEAVDAVSYDEIKGDYMYIKQVTEQYTMHTRRVAHRIGKFTYFKTQTYWTWDYRGKDSKKCKNVKFCGVNFKSKKIEFPSSQRIATVKCGYNLRHVYYAVEKKNKGTIFTKLEDGTIKDASKFYKGSDINQTLENLTSNAYVVIFWIIWILVIAAVTVGFFYFDFDNAWLE